VDRSVRSRHATVEAVTGDLGHFIGTARSRGSGRRGDRKPAAERGRSVLSAAASSGEGTSAIPAGWMPLRQKGEDGRRRLGHTSRLSSIATNPTGSCVVAAVRKGQNHLRRRGPYKKSGVHSGCRDEGHTGDSVGQRTRSDPLARGSDILLDSEPCGAPGRTRGCSDCYPLRPGDILLLLEETGPAATLSPS